jgi:hypothetical protein
VTLCQCGRDAVRGVWARVCARVDVGAAHAHTRRHAAVPVHHTPLWKDLPVRGPFSFGGRRRRLPSPARLGRPGKPGSCADMSAWCTCMSAHTAATSAAKATAPRHVHPSLMHTHTHTHTHVQGTHLGAEARRRTWPCICACMRGSDRLCAPWPRVKRRSASGSTCVSTSRHTTPMLSCRCRALPPSPEG